MKALNKHTIDHWKQLEKVIHVPHNEKEYEQLVRVLNELVDTVGQDEKHPLANLLELVGCCLEAYETTNHQLPKVSPVKVLFSLMEEHQLTQSDLPEIGNQSVVSQILAGKRKLNARQIKALSKRFNLPADAFVS